MFSTHLCQPPLAGKTERQSQLTVCRTAAAPFCLGTSARPVIVIRESHLVQPFPVSPSVLIVDLSCRTYSRIVCCMKSPMIDFSKAFDVVNHVVLLSKLETLKLPYIYFCPVVSFFFFFLSSPNLSGRRSDVYHTSTHGVALVRI